MKTRGEVELRWPQQPRGAWSDIASAPTAAFWPDGAGGSRCVASLCSCPSWSPFLTFHRLPGKLGLHGFPISATKSDSLISVKGRSVLNSGKPEIRPKRRGACGALLGSAAGGRLEQLYQVFCRLRRLLSKSLLDSPHP